MFHGSKFYNFTLTLLMLFLSITKAYSFDLIVNEREFFQLSKTCQKYLYSTIGQRLAFDVPYSRDEIASARIEAENAGGAWHYCGGLVWLNRAIVAADPQSKKRAYSQALSEINFTARKIAATSYMYSEVRVNFARVLYYNKQHSRSRSVLNSLLQQNPSMTAARLEFARQLRAEKHTRQAIELLEKATAKEFEISADLNYFLGVYQYHEGNYTAAKKYGEQAYKLGYPLPWLKNNLAKKGL